MLGLFKSTLMLLVVGGSLSTVAAAGSSAQLPDMRSCDQVLKMSSRDFINQYTQAHGDNTIEKINAIYQYNDCYSQHLDALRTQLNKSGRHPLMGANANFGDFEKALNDFTTTALGFCSPQSSFKRVTAAYAMLYQQQFRQLFYQQFQPKAKQPAVNPKAISAAKAKLEDLINRLPKNQIEVANKTFSAYFEAAVKGVKLPAQPVYEYAIMLLQSPTDKPYSSPPF